ncbi:MAG: DUF4091 domain-containing protein [Armatimonadota bacterium]|nr:DUF4091 domain-containing protein [Armatimonadota bacterium]
MRLRIIFYVAFVLLVGLSEEYAMPDEPCVTVWTQDALVKVLPDAKPDEGASRVVRIDAVRNEYESGQVVVTGNREIEKLAFSLGKVDGAPGPKPRVEAHFVGYVPVKKGTPDPPAKAVAKAPADLPDPLLDAAWVSVQAGKNQPIWITVFVPPDCRPGLYTTELRVCADGFSTVVPVEINVHPVTLPNDRTLKITNWFNPGKFSRSADIGSWKKTHWKIARSWARIMAAHRQNVVITPIMQLITGREDDAGNIEWDFSQFDRWIQLFKEEGVVGYIEGSHLGGRNEWEAPDFDAYLPNIYSQDGTLKPKPNIKVTSAEEQQFLSRFLPALQKHLEEKGWIDIYFQHLCDEPITANAESYKKLASYVRQYAPKLKIIDACQCTEIAGSIDIWVPLTDHFERDLQFYKDRQRAGEEVWFYTCLAPRGDYMNRFIDYPLLDVRLIHWMNFRYNVSGYLHWGLNYWHGDAFKDLEPDWGGGNYLPPGDSHIVYPGRRGPLSSIRFEAMRDGIEDYELLKLLEKVNPGLANEIAVSVVRTGTDYTLDPKQFRAARHRLICALER